MKMSEEDFDISWFTQESKDSDVPNFDVGMRYIEEELVVERSEGGVVSLEEGPGFGGGVLLYDNVYTEEISLDDGVDSM